MGHSRGKGGEIRPKTILAGYGLSYSSWHYSDLTVTPSSVTPCSDATVTVTVANTGSVDSDEVV